MAIGHYKELRVHGLCVEVRRGVFALSKGWPKEERYALTDQIRRSSRSIGANLAEAWAKRRYERHFVSKLTDALAEAAETMEWLDVALECGYIAPDEHLALSEQCDRLCGGLVRMMREPEKWCGPSGLIREDDVTYDLDA